MFVGGGRVHDLEAEGYPVLDVPMASTLYRNNRVDLAATAANAVRVFLGGRKVVEVVRGTIRTFDPHLIVTDYEYFTPLAARAEGRPCVSIDHQHILTHCLYAAPSLERFSRLITCGSVQYLYSNASMFLIVSFFDLPPLDPETTRVFAPVIRRAVRQHVPANADHVLVYQTSPTFHRLFPVLEQAGSRFTVYGLGARDSHRNLVFKAPATEGFLQDLASCRYVITNGGHNVISEALYFKKPVLSFPIANAYEQFLNAYFLARRGYGDFSVAKTPSLSLLESFESRLDAFRTNIGRESFVGNCEIVEALESLIANAPKL